MGVGDGGGVEWPFYVMWLLWCHLKKLTLYCCVALDQGSALMILAEQFLARPCDHLGVYFCEEGHHQLCLPSHTVTKWSNHFIFKLFSFFVDSLFETLWLGSLRRTVIILNTCDRGSNPA